MSVRDWLFFTTAGLALLAGLVVTGLNNKAQQNVNTPNQGSPAVNVYEQFEVPERNPNPERQEWREEEGLWAQQEMAKWTTIMAILSGFGLVIAFAGLIFVARTYRVAQDTARRQLRAYVTMDKVEITRFAVNEPLEISIPMKNCGQTPALNFRGWHVIDIVRIADKPFEDGTYAAWSTYPLGPGMTARAYLQNAIVITRPLYDGIVNRLFEVRVWGRDEYTDIYGTSQFLEYRYVHTGPVTLPQRMMAHREGNRAS